MSIAYRKKIIFQQKYGGKKGAKRGEVTAVAERGRSNAGKIHKTDGPDLTR